MKSLISRRLTVRRRGSLPGVLLAFLLICLSALTPSVAQDGPPLARISFFNALPAEVPLFVTWNGLNAFANGIAQGQSFGPFNVEAVSTPAEFKAEGFKEAGTSIDLERDTRRAFVVYAAALEKDPGDGSEKRALRIFAMPSLPESAAGKKLDWPLVLVGLAPTAQVEVNGKPVTLTRNKSVIVAKGERYVEVKQGKKELIAVSVEGPEDYVLVVFGDTADDLAGGIIYR